MAASARQNGRTLQAEMQAQGFKDFHAFSKSCPRFRKGCWPIELAELGSGYVLYFQFLGFLMCIFLAHLCLQVPVMAIYSEASNLADWYHLDDWTKAYSDDATMCNCIGNSAGVGASCGAWDMPLCENETSCAFSTPGKYVCQSWCYTSKYCPRIDSASPSMRNAYIFDGSNINILVKAYSACDQNASLTSQCTDFRSADVEYSGADVATNQAVWIGTFWLSPGNTGPDEATSPIVPTMYTVCLIALCVLIVMAYSSQVLTDYKVDAGTISPNDFAIMVKGLPSTATDEDAIMEFFKEHAVKGKTDTEIVKVVIGWDIEEFRENISKLKELKKRLDEKDSSDPEVKNIKAEMAQITTALKSAGTKDAKLRSSGVVVVVFRHQSDMRACLRKWTSVWARWFSCEAEDVGFLWRNNALCKGAALPKFPIGGRPIATLSVARAANPGDIHWTELAVPANLRRWRLLTTNGVMFLLVAACFGAVYGLRQASEAVKEAGGSAGIWLSLLPALTVAIVNAFLMAAARYLGDKEYHDTLTEQEFSQAAKMSVGMVVNTAGVLFFIYSQPKEWYQDGGLVNGAFTMLLINAFVPPLVPYMDLGFKVRSMQRNQLTDEKLEYMNQVLMRGPNPKDPEQIKELKEVKAQIEKFKKAWAPSSMNATRRYANALKTFMCCLLYEPVLPLISLVGLIGLCMQYWMDKYLLLTWYARPSKPLSADIANFFVRFVKWVGPIFYSVSFFIFVTPSYADKSVVLSQFIICIVISTIFSIVFPLSVWMRVYLGMPCRSEMQMLEHENDYYQAQYMWSKEMKYHKDQFIYKNLPEDKNPEMLKPGESSAINPEDMKDSYGASAEKMAEDATYGVTAKVALKGGRVVATGADPDSISTVPTSPTPAPTTYGVAVSPEPAPGPGPAAAAEEEGPSVPLVGGTLPGTAETGGGRHGRVTWEYEWKDHFSAYDGDCQSYIERKYQEFLKGGRDRVNVRTQGFEVSVDFKRMTSKREKSDRIQKIRRKESE
ncbi:CBP3 [Symbiodinium sp. CCMP2456]|nr:CBP3 [Symbiodinium sp. CCMP2456]